MAQVALAWVLRNPGVPAPIVGATKSRHLEEAAHALDIDLTDDEARTLEEPYVQQGPSWFWHRQCARPRPLVVPAGRRRSTLVNVLTRFGIARSPVDNVGAARSVVGNTIYPGDPAARWPSRAALAQAL